MNTIECFTVTMIIALWLFPYENNAGLSDECTTSIEDIQYDVVGKSNIYLKRRSDHSFISLLHDIPLNTGQQGVFRAVIVMPKQCTVGKKINMFDKWNPITRLHFKKNPSFPALEWNYGALTQTWQNKSVIDPITGKYGDNGIMDVFVFSENEYKNGSVVNVKVFGAYPMINSDTSRSKWQILGIDVKDQSAERVHNIEDFNREFPDFLIKIKDWLKSFTIAYDNTPNTILEEKDVAMAVQVVNDNHNLWKMWQEDEEDDIARCFLSHVNVTLNNRWTLKK